MKTLLYTIETLKIHNYIQNTENHNKPENGNSTVLVLHLDQLIVAKHRRNIYSRCYLHFIYLYGKCNTGQSGTAQNVKVDNSRSLIFSPTRACQMFEQTTQAMLYNYVR